MFLLFITISDEVDKEGIQKTSCVFKEINKNVPRSKAERSEN